MRREPALRAGHSPRAAEVCALPLVQEGFSAVFVLPRRDALPTLTGTDPDGHGARRRVVPPRESGRGSCRGRGVR